MARLKRSSTVIETARHRLAGLKAITAELDFGPGLTREDYEAEIKEVSDKLDEYNGLLAKLDEMKNNYEAKERALQTKNARMLSAIGGRFGDDSNEYEQCGGVRRSERKRPRRKSGTAGGKGTSNPS